MFKIGTLADWFGVGLIKGIQESEKCGAEGVQLYAAGELDPRTLTPSELKKVQTTLRDCHQTVAAICGELGGFGFEKPDENKKKLAYLKGVVDLSMELGCHVVTTHIGVVPIDPQTPRYTPMLAAMTEMGQYAFARDCTIAIETGPEAITTLSDFVDACGRGVGVNYDPANIVMVTGVDHVEGVKIAGKRIVHTHAKDGVNITPIPAEEFYHKFAEGGLEWMATLGTMLMEKPLGKGDVRWQEYLAALRDIGYDGFLTIEREAKNGSGDIANAVTFLREQISQLK